MNPRKEDPVSAVSRAFIVKVASVLCTICVAVFAWGFKTMDANSERSKQNTMSIEQLRQYREELRDDVKLGFGELKGILQSMDTRLRAVETAVKQ